MLQVVGISPCGQALSRHDKMGARHDITTVILRGAKRTRRIPLGEAPLTLSFRLYKVRSGEIQSFCHSLRLKIQCEHKDIKHIKNVGAISVKCDIIC